MDAYTITITPNDSSGNSTTLTVDTSTGQARITSVHMHAPSGLSGAQMPSVDVGLLLQAVTGPMQTQSAIAAAPAQVEAAAPQTAPVLADTEVIGGSADEPPTSAATVSATGDTPQASAPVAAPARRTGPRQAARTAAARTGEGEAAPSSGAHRSRKQTSPKAAATKPARKQAAAAAGGGERTYRRMPEDFAAVYRQAGTAAAISDHYGVPRYTAQGWIGRHKKQNAITTS